MAGSVWVILKKIFSIALIFNALISITAVAGMLYGFYTSNGQWRPFAPYLLDGNLFWLALAAGIICIFPAAATGRSLHTGRFLFHHYVYGFIVLAITAGLVAILTPFSFISMFFIDSNEIGVNAARVFFLGGLALFLDDLPDVSLRTERCLNWIKTRCCGIKKTLHYSTLVTGIFAIYCSFAMLASTVADNFYRWLPNSFGIVTLLLTGIMSIGFYVRKDWLKITPPEPKQPKLFA
ncbi:MAG TPA: hypothetical protein VLH35_00175 [Candidatus Acidoferrales bacterium]|nr:hypothetical protein [Candidatus Acidoferrales bacterium]